MCFLIISFLFVNLFSVVSLYCRFTDLSFHYSSDIGIIIMFHSAMSVCIIYSCVIWRSVVFVLLFPLIITMIVLPNMSSHSQMFYWSDSQITLVGWICLFSRFCHYFIIIFHWQLVMVIFTVVGVSLCSSWWLKSLSFGLNIADKLVSGVCQCNLYL